MIACYMKRGTGFSTYHPVCKYAMLSDFLYRSLLFFFNGAYGWVASLYVYVYLDLYVPKTLLYNYACISYVHVYLMYIHELYVQFCVYNQYSLKMID